MRRAWLAIVGALAGCDVVFDVQPVDPSDAAPAAACPAAFDARTGDHPDARFFFDTTGRTVWEHQRVCAAATPGRTHLVDIASERDVQQLLATAIARASDQAFYVGAFQPFSDGNREPGPAAGWLRLTSAPLPYVWDDAEPRDGTDNSENEDENYAVISSGRPGGLADWAGDTTADSQTGAICACDDVAVSEATVVRFAAQETTTR